MLNQLLLTNCVKMKIEYEVAREDDLEKLIQFLMNPEIDQAFVKPLSERDITIAERVHLKFKNGCWLLAKDQEQIAGCLALIPQQNEVEISTYAISPNYRRMGIGSELLDRAITLTEKTYPYYKFIILDSWEGNTAISRVTDKKEFTLREIYDDLGKRPEGIRTVVYEKRLQSKDS